MFPRSAAANCRSDKCRAGSDGNNGTTYGSPGANGGANAGTDRNHSADVDAHCGADGNGDDCTYCDTDRNSHGCAHRNSQSNPNGHA